MACRLNPRMHFYIGICCIVCEGLAAHSCFEWFTNYYIHQQLTHFRSISWKNVANITLLLYGLVTHLHQCLQSHRPLTASAFKYAPQPVPVVPPSPYPISRFDRSFQYACQSFQHAILQQVHNASMPIRRIKRRNIAQRSRQSHSLAYQRRSVHSPSSFHTPWTEHSIVASHFSQILPHTRCLSSSLCQPHTRKYKQNVKIREQYKRAKAQVQHVTVLVQEVEHTGVKSYIGKQPNMVLKRKAP